MSVRHAVGMVVGAAALASGCAMSQKSPSMNNDGATVAVRFVMPPDSTSFADSTVTSPRPTMSLGVESTDGGFANESLTLSTATTPMDRSHHVVLWGGPFYGEDATYATTMLPPGNYMFGLFNQDESSVYQGWINVNTSGDDLLQVLTEWRNTIREQQEWLGFEYKIQGKFASADPGAIRGFQKQLRRLEALEKRLAKMIDREAREWQEESSQRHAFLGNAEILLMPGGTPFFLPTTQPAFDESDLTSVHNGKNLTKVMLLADYARAVEKLRRVNNIREDLKRCQAVFSEEAERLERRKRFFMLTDHLYNHGSEFVDNERRLQQVRGVLHGIDEQLADHRMRSLALTFMSGLFSPNANFDSLDQEQRDLQHHRIVLMEKKHQIDQRFDATSPDNAKRVHLERQRQETLASIESIDDQLNQIKEARTAIASLNKDTGIIHRQGPARLVTATLVDNSFPGYLVDAIEREAVMTVRLQAAESLFTPPTGRLTTMQQKTTTTTHTLVGAQ